MPVSADLAANLAKDTLRVYTDAEELLLQRVAARLAAGIDEPGWAERKLIDIQRLRADVAEVLARLDREGPTAVEAAVRTAYNRGVATAGADLAAATSLAPQAAFGAVNTAAVDALVASAQAAVAGTHLRITRTALDVYQQVTTETAAQVLTGTQTRREAAQRALGRYARTGVTGFVDTAGRAWDMASYVEMATRTASGQAAVQGHVNRLAEMGQDLVIVSDAPQECVICRPWEGKVLSVTGATTGRVRGENLRGSGTVTVQVAGTLREATAAGLFHPGCRHSTALYIPGVTKPLTRTADPVGDAARQRQRELERRVRRAKREQAAALGEPARRAAGAKVRAQQGALAEHIEANDLKALPYRTSLGAR